jgi:excisionase family DNA binding protein
MERGIKETQSVDITEVDKAIEDSIKALARTIVKEILREFAVQWKVFSETGEYSTSLFPDLDVTRQSRPLTLSVPEAAKLLGLSRVTMYEAVHIKQIPSIRIGRRIIIPRIALIRFLQDAGTTLQDSLQSKP